MSGLIVNTQKLCEIYKEWRGNESCYDNGRPVFEADELLDFAQYCLTHEANGIATSERKLTIPDISCPLCGRGNGVTQKMLDAEYYVRAYIKKYDKPPTYRNVAKHFDIAVCASHARLRHCRELMRARDNGS